MQHLQHLTRSECSGLELETVVNNSHFGEDLNHGDCFQVF